MAIRVTDKDGKTIRFEAMFVDRMVNLTGLYDIGEIDDDENLLLMIKDTDKDGVVTMQAQHWCVPKVTRDKMLEIAQKWLALNKEEGRCT